MNTNMESAIVVLKPGVGNRPVIAYAHLSLVDQIA